RTSLDPVLQVEARKALQDGLLNYDERRGFRGPVEQIDVSGDWGAALAKIRPLRDVPEWKLAVVLDAGEQAVDIGMQPETDAGGKVVQDRTRGRIPAENMKWAYRD